MHLVLGRGGMRLSKRHLTVRERTGEQAPAPVCNSIEICRYISIVTTESSRISATDEGWIRKPVQVRALRSPVRQEIVDALEAGGPATMAELAHGLGRRPDALYFHVRQLLRVSLIRELTPRREGRHVASVYDVAWRPMRLSYESGVSGKSLSAVVGAAMRLAVRDFAASARIKPPGAAGAGRPAHLWGARRVGWLDPDEINRVNRLLEEASNILRQGKPRKGSRAMSLSFVLSPSHRDQKDKGEST